MDLSIEQGLGYIGLATAGICSVLAYLDAVVHGNHYRQRHESKTAHGTAAWARRRDLNHAGLFNDEGLILGRFGRRMLRLASDRHRLTLAPTRSGKGVSTIIPNLLTWPGSIVVIDPKGENATVTARRRRDMGQDVHILDPWGVTGQASARYNPLDALDTESPDFADDAALLADAMVQVQGDVTDSSFWNEEARALLCGLIMHTATGEPPHRRSLVRVREQLTIDKEDLQTTLKAMQESTAACGLVARAANRVLQKEEREYSYVISTAQAQTHFLDSPALASVLAASTFRLETLKRRPVSIYLVVPTSRMHTHARWLRLMIAKTLDILAADTEPPERPVLFLLDEFAALGRLASIETAMGLMAGFGVRLWPILQDLSQLRDLYPARWSSFIANAGAIQAFSVNDLETAKYLSALLGNRTVTVRADTANLDNGSTHYSQVARPLLLPDELLQLPADRQVLILQGCRPVLTDKVRYYADREFAGLFDPNPFYRRPA